MHKYIDDYACVDCTSTGDYVDGRDALNCITGADATTASCASNYIFSFAQLAMSPLMVCYVASGACSTLSYLPPALSASDEATNWHTLVTFLCIAADASHFKLASLFAVESCINYYKNTFGCNGLDGATMATVNAATAGACNMPLTEGTSCIVPTSDYTTNGAQSTSGGFGGCSDPTHYVANYICDVCTGATEYVDGANAVNCLTISSVGANSFIYIDVTGLKVLSQYATARDTTGGQETYWGLTTSTDGHPGLLTLSSCSGNNILGDFCITETCYAYSHNTGCADDLANTAGNCDLALEDSGVCI